MKKRFHALTYLLIVLATIPSTNAMQEDTQIDKLRKYKKISESLVNMEYDYRKCITDIKDSEFDQENLDACVGKNYVKLALDIKYQTMRIMSKSETKIRNFFIESCYMKAGIDPIFSTACDILERDVIDFMWNGLNFVKLITINRLKYTYEYAEMPDETMDEIIDFLKTFSKEFFSYLNEIDSHKQRSIIHLKEKIESRKLVEAVEEVSIDEPSEDQLVDHVIQVQKELMTPSEKAEFAPKTEEEPARKLIKSNSSNAHRKKDSGIRLFGQKGKYAGLNSPNYTYKNRKLGSKHEARRAFPNIGGISRHHHVGHKNVHVNFIQHQIIKNK